MSSVNPRRSSPPQRLRTRTGGHKLVAWLWSRLAPRVPPTPAGVSLLVRVSVLRHPYVGSQAMATIPAIPHLFGLDTFDAVQVSGTGLLLLFAPQRVYYLPLGEVSEAALRNAHINRLSLRQSPLADLPPSRWHQHWVAGLSVASAERLVPCACPVTCAQEVLARLRRLGQDGRTLRATEVRWRRVVAAICPTSSSEFWNTQIRLLSERVWTVGPTHGDLTPGNIMYDPTADRCKLLDLDRFSWHGVQLFDTLHFRVEEHCRKNSIDWIATVEASALDDVLLPCGEPDGRHKSSAGHSALGVCIAFYILERLRHELRMSVDRMPESWVMRVRRLLSSTALQRRIA